MSHYKGKYVTVGQKQYKIVKPVGSGGNGSVWRVQEEGAKQQYAIKFLASENADKIARF